MQARADIIALDMVRLADGRTESQILGDMGYPTYLSGSAARNEVETSKLTVAYGTVNTQGTFVETLASGVPNAVKVTAAEATDYFFAPGSGGATRSAIAMTRASAGFSIGSFAASVSSGSGPLLNSLIGNALNLGVLSYSGLATANLSYLGIATQLGLATPSELFTTDVSAFESLAAAAQILQQDSANAAQVAVLNQVLAVPNSPLHDVNMADLVTVQAGGEEAALASTANVFDILTAAAFLSDGSSGISIPATALSLPGTNVTGALNIVQAPQTVFGSVGDWAETAQAGLTAGFRVDTGTLCSSTTDLLNLLLSLVPNLLSLLTGGPTCGLLGLNKLVHVELDTTVVLSLAKARGTIARIACTSADELDIDVRSDLVSANVNVSARVMLGTTQLASLPLSLAAGGGAANGDADFVLPPDQYNVFRGSVPNSGSLGIEDAQIQGLGALGTLLTPLVNPVLTTALDTLNETVIVPLSDALGLRVAGADVAPRAVTCGNVALVG